MALLAGKELKLAIATLKKDAKDWVKRIELLAQSACVETVKTKNTTRLNELADATKDIGSRALMRWIEKHGPVKYDKDTESFVLSDKKLAAAAADVEAYATEISEAESYSASAKPSDSNPFKGLDLTARVKSLIKQAKEVMADSTKASASGNDFAILAGLEAIVSGIKPTVSTVAGPAVTKPRSSKGKRVTAETVTANTVAV